MTVKELKETLDKYDDNVGVYPHLFFELVRAVEYDIDCSSAVYDNGFVFLMPQEKDEN